MADYLIDNCDIGSVHRTERKKVITDSFSCTGPKGKSLTYDLESIATGVGRQFQGYFVAPMRILYNGEPPKYVPELVKEAEQYFKEHPEMVKEKDKKYLKPELYIYDPAGLYCRLLIERQARNDISQGRATTMQRAYIFQKDHGAEIAANGYFFSFSQLNGTGPGPELYEDPTTGAKEARMKSEHSEEFEKWRKEWEDFEQSADIGEKTLREKLKKEKASQKVIIKKLGDGQRAVINPETSQEIPLNENEKNALIRYAINRKSYQK